jgi:hypothetical protein
MNWLLKNIQEEAARVKELENKATNSNFKTKSKRFEQNSWSENHKPGMFAASLGV